MINFNFINEKKFTLGSGELGKEFVIACQRLGQYVVAVDNYKDAPAMPLLKNLKLLILDEIN